MASDGSSKITLDRENKDGLREVHIRVIPWMDHGSERCFGDDVLTVFAKDRSTGSTMLPITWH